MSIEVADHPTNRPTNRLTDRVVGVKLAITITSLRVINVEMKSLQAGVTRQHVQVSQGVAGSRSPLLPLGKMEVEGQAAVGVVQVERANCEAHQLRQVTAKHLRNQMQWIILYTDCFAPPSVRPSVGMSVCT